jgi:hypothetical protein
LGQRHFHCERVGGTRRQPVSRFALQNAKRVETLESLSKRLLTTDPIVHAARGEWSQALEHWEEAGSSTISPKSGGRRYARQ